MVRLQNLYAPPPQKKGRKKRSDLSLKIVKLSCDLHPELRGPLHRELQQSAKKRKKKTLV